MFENRTPNIFMAANHERVVQEAATVRIAQPDDAATIAQKLADSLSVARAHADDCPVHERLSSGYVPFSLQRKVQETEQIFLVSDTRTHAPSDNVARGLVYVGSEYAAADTGLLRGMNIARVINVTAGSRRVPNFGESIPDWRVSYTNYELHDQMGESVPAISRAMSECAACLEAHTAAGQSVLVHCSAGLCRSATMVLAWLMHAQRMSLADAVAHFASCRGRLPQPSARFQFQTHLSTTIQLV